LSVGDPDLIALRHDVRIVDESHHRDLIRVERKRWIEVMGSEFG
jgi:hypothetical protein